MAEGTLPPLPPGFVLDGPPQQPQQAQQTLPPLPDGFVLDGAPTQAAQPDNRSWLGKAGDAVSDWASSAANAVTRTVKGGQLSDVYEVPATLAKNIATELPKSLARSGALPGDVYAGREDLSTQQGVDRAIELASFVNPTSAGSRLRQVAPQAAPQVVRDAAESGVSLTAGQRTGNPALLAREDAAFGGGLGARAQEVAQAARARQMDELFRAREGVGEMAGRGAATLERPADAGGIVADAVKANAQAAKMAYNEKYAKAFSSDGSFRPETFSGMSKSISDNLAARSEPVIVDEVLTPAANKALKELDNVQNLKLGTNGQPGAGDTVAGVNLRGVDQARKRLRAYASAAATDADRRAASEVIKEFDSHIEQAVTKGLFDGDEKFLAALKDARGEYAAYQRNFKKQNSFDDAGRVLETMVRQDVTPEQVANYIFGSSKVGANATNVRVVRRLKELLGSDSAEWSAIRQGAWNKVSGISEGATPMGGQKAATRIADFINGEGRTFARELFSPEEITAMQKHASIERATAARAGTTNPSNSGNRLAGLLRDSVATIGGMLGMGAGGPQGAAAGYAAGRAAGGVGDFVNAAQTRALYRGQEPISIGQRVGGVAGTAQRQLAPPIPVLLSGQGEGRK